jgi:hypothetical protein
VGFGDAEFTEAIEASGTVYLYRMIRSAHIDRSLGRLTKSIR